MRRAIMLLALLAAVLSSPAAAAPPVATAELAPRVVFFADRVQARVDVIVDARVDDPARTSVVTPLGVWGRVGTTVVTTTRGGQLVRRRWTFSIACRVSDCVPTSGEQSVRLPPAQVTIVARDGSQRHLVLRWPRLTVAARTTASPGATPAFRLQTSPPASSPRISASLAAALFLAAAVLLLGAAGALAALEMRRRRMKHAPDVRPLTRALALAREAQQRPPADRRRALALLARLAATRDPALAADAGGVAWEQPEPEAERMAEIVRRAEQLEDER